MLTLTLLRVVTLLTAAVSLLMSVIVALPTPSLFDTFWLVTALSAASGYVLTTWLFLKAAQRAYWKLQPAEVL